MWICVQWVRLWSFQTFHVPKMGRHLPPPWSISENQILHTGPPVWHLACGRACHSFVFLGNLIWLSLARSSPAPSLEPRGSNAVLSGALSLEGEKVVMGKHHPQRGCRTASRLEAHSPPGDRNEWVPGRALRANQISQPRAEHYSLLLPSPFPPVGPPSQSLVMQPQPPLPRGRRDCESPVSPGL